MAAVLYGRDDDKKGAKAKIEFLKRIGSLGKFDASDKRYDDFRPKAPAAAATPAPEPHRNYEPCASVIFCSGFPIPILADIPAFAI